jgi:hypothetical protein
MFHAPDLLLALLTLTPMASPAPAPQGPGVEPLAYDPAGGIDLCWLDDSRLAVASDGGLRVQRFHATGSEVTPGPALELKPLLAGSPGFLAGATTAGELVVWDTSDWSELGRRPGLAEGTTVLALAAGGRSLVVGDAAGGLFEVGLDAAMPRPVDYPGPGPIEDLAFDASGHLHVLPSGWTWDPATRAWSAGEPLRFEDPSGGNLAAWGMGADLAGSFREESPTTLELGPLGAWVPDVRVDLGYRRPQDVALSPELALLSFPGAEATAGYGPQDAEPTELLGRLELYDPSSGVLLASLPESGRALGPAESAEHRTLVIGLEVELLTGGRALTLDVVDHESAPTLWLRLRDKHLVATAEVQLDAGQGPVYLATGDELVAVVYEEQLVQVFQLDEESGLVPGPRIEIGTQDDPTGATVPAPRRIFAVHPAGQLMAMVSDSGSIFFANPSTGWPHQVVSVRLPQEAGRPRAARFRPDGELVVICEALSASEIFPLYEFTLDAEQVRWSPGLGASSRTHEAGTWRLSVSAGMPGNLDLVTGLQAGKPELVGRVSLGILGGEALAVSPGRDLAVAIGGRVVQLEGAMFGGLPRGSRAVTPEGGR